MVKANLAPFWMRIGDQDRVEEWFYSCGLTPDDPMRCINEPEYLSLARVLIWMGRTEDALKVLARIHDLALSQGRNGKRLQVLMLQALALQQSNDLDAALQALETSLKLAQPEGYVRLFVEEGEAMAELLRLGAARGIWQPGYLTRFVNQLLQAIQQDRAQVEAAGKP
jgi:LuxR family maltose regulon positive regulatory protein